MFRLTERSIDFAYIILSCTPSKWLCLSYTMFRAHVRGDNAKAGASALSHVYAQNHGITDFSHLHACRPSTSRDISC